MAALPVQATVFLCLLTLMSRSMSRISALQFHGPQQLIDVVKYAEGDFLIPMPPKDARGSMENVTVPLNGVAGFQRRMPQKGSAEGVEAAASTPFVPDGMRASVNVNPQVGVVGFPGLSAYEEATSGTGLYAGSNAAFAPSDAAMAVGGGYVVQVVNSAIRVFRSRNKRRLTLPTPLNQFFNVTPWVRRNGTDTIIAFGDNILDPHVAYDGRSQRWFVSAWGTRGPDSTRFAEDEAFQVLAVSRTRSPLRGFVYYKYNADLLDSEALHAVAGPCPCYPDYALIGFDEYGVHITADSYSLISGNFVGAQIYSINKRALTWGRDTTVAARFDGAAAAGGRLLAPRGGGAARTLQPAAAPGTFRAEDCHNGTQYFLSTSSDSASGPSVTLWALTNTASLRAHPNLRLSQYSVPASLPYSTPPPAKQKDGPAPLADSYKEALPMLDSGSASMHQVVYAENRLWAAFTTAVKDPSENSTKSGIYWLALKVGINSKGNVRGKVLGSGVISINKTWAFYPAITVNTKKAFIGFVISSTTIYPSLAYAYVSPTNYTASEAFLAFEGVGPYDGGTGLTEFLGNGVSRFGDYSTSCVDEFGDFWFTGQTVTGKRREVEENWGTYIVQVPGN